MKNKTGFETQWEIKVIRCCVNRIRQSIGVNTRDRFLIFETTEKKKSIESHSVRERESRIFAEIMRKFCEHGKEKTLMERSE